MHNPANNNCPKNADERNESCACKNNWDFNLPIVDLTAIKINSRVEISPRYDLYMQGDKFGTIANITHDVALVFMDKTSRYLQFPIADLKRV